MRTLTTICALVAIVALYGCGSGSLTESGPTALEDADGCQPGDIVEVNIEGVISIGSEAGGAGKGIFTRLEMLGGTDIGAACAELLVSIPEVDGVITDSLKLVKIDGTPIAADVLQIADLDAGEVCVNPQRCLEKYMETKPSGARIFHLDGYAHCYDFAEAVYVRENWTIRHAFTTALKKETLAIVSVGYWEKTAFNVWDHNFTSITPDPIYDGLTEGYVDFKLLAELTPEQQAMWEFYEKKDIDKRVRSFGLVNPYPNLDGTSYGEVIAQMSIEIELPLHQKINTFRIDELASAMNSCEDAADPVLCGMQTFLE